MIKKRGASNSYLDTYKHGKFRCDCIICQQQQISAFDEKIVFPELIEINNTKNKNK